MLLFYPSKIDYFNISVHVVINGKDTVIHSKSVTGDNVNINKMTIGTIEGQHLNEQGEPITFWDLEEIYMLVKWRDERNQIFQE